MHMKSLNVSIMKMYLCSHTGKQHGNHLWITHFHSKKILVSVIEGELQTADDAQVKIVMLSVGFSWVSS